MVATAGLIVLIRADCLQKFAPPLGVGLVMLANVLVSNNYERFLAACPLERRHVDGHKFVGTWEDYSHGRTYPNDHVGVTRRRAFRVACDAFRLMVRHDPSGGDPNVLGIWLWYPVQDRCGSIFSAICSTYMWNQRTLSQEFPDILDQLGERRSLGDMGRMVVLSDNARPLLPEAAKVARAARPQINPGERRFDF